MGVCCSKDEVVKIKETVASKPEDRGPLIQENIGPGGGNLVSSGNQISRHENNPHIPVIQEPQGVQTQEAEAVNTYNKQDDFAVRSTLIFPSYTGYRNQDPFGVLKKSPLSDSAPTALVSPFRSNAPNSYLNPSGKDSITPRHSPLPSRYSPMLNPNRDRRVQSVQPRVFERRLANSRRGSIESGGFDSDLESENEETTPNIEAPPMDLTNFTSEVILAIPADDKILKGVDKLKEVSDDLTASLESFSNTKNDMGIGTEDLSFKKETQKMETNTELPQKTTTNASVETGPESKLKQSVSTGTEISDSSKKKTGTAAGIQATENYLKMVDASVGTDSDNFYRSTKTKKVQIDPKKKKPLLTASASTGTGTDLDFELPSRITTHNMGVGTDPVATDSTTQKAIAKKKKKEKEKKSYVKLVDACVGTDSDNFYRSKKSRKVEANTKNKPTTATLSTGIGTNPEPSPKPKPKISPRIAVDKAPASPVKKMNAATNSPSANAKKVEDEKRYHPIIETLEDAFTRFAKYGDINYDGKEMNNKNWAKLCRDCEFIDNRHVLVGDIDVIFSRHKPKGYRLIDFEMFKNCLNEIADKTFSHKIKDEWTRREIVYRNVIGKAPEMVGITGTSKTGNVDRMTDHTLYPVSHKMRFDEEGRGLGIEEKFEVQDSYLGYVQGYKDRDTYDSKMLGITREKSGTNMTSPKLSPRLLRRPISSGSNRS